MRILVTGANGQLGNEMQVLAKENLCIILRMFRNLIYVIKKPFGHIFLKNRLM